MPLPSFLQRQDKPATDRKKAPPPAGDSGPVQAARTRARRRLIGAVVLLAVGIVGFPLVFETRPRPFPPDIRIDAPAAVADAAAPASLPSAALAPPPQSAPPLRKPVPEPITEPASDTGQEEPPAPAVHASVPAAASKTPAPEPKMAAPAPKPAPAAPKPAPAAPKPVPETRAQAGTDDGSRARALLDGSAASAAKPGRFVVQVGAYTDAAALREARQRVEKLGLKTYTQVVETDAGKRTRVRVGPFASHDEADRAAARLKAAGLPAAILTL